MKPGDLILQARLPGGVCVYLDEEIVEEGRVHDDHSEELYYWVLHPTEGLILDAAYYYQEVQAGEAHWVLSRGGGDA